jgi:hypothetical protein
MVPMLTDQQLDEAMTDALRALDMNRFEDLAAEADQRQNERRQRLARPDALAQAAAWYAAQGIAVFPCRPRGKAPITRHGFYDAAADTEIVRQWWRDTPTANIGAPTGNLFDCIDIDGPPGYHSLGQMRERGVLPRCIGRSRTPGNPPGRPPGMHYLIAPTGDGCTTGLMPGIDYRGSGGYIILPPSLGANGEQYEWLEPPQVGA